MKRSKWSDATDGAEEAAARGFVRVDSGLEPDDDAQLVRWLANRSVNERAMERIELAVELGRRLAADPASPLHVEMLRAVQPRSRRRSLVAALAWGGALAAGLVVAVWVGRDGVPVEPELLVMDAARRVAFDAPTTAVAVLPSGVVVDASAVAVLPFVGAGEGSLAAGLEHDIATALRSVPGLYVIAGAAVRPYAGTELGVAELGGQLGARGLVDASVELVDGRVRISARLRESATGATLWQTQADRPVDELRAVRAEIADHVAAAMFDSTLRARAAHANDARAQFSAKPFQQ